MLKKILLGLALTAVLCAAQGQDSPIAQAQDGSDVMTAEWADVSVRCYFKYGKHGGHKYGGDEYDGEDHGGDDHGAGDYGAEKYGGKYGTCAFKYYGKTLYFDVRDYYGYKKGGYYDHEVGKQDHDDVRNEL